MKLTPPASHQDAIRELSAPPPARQAVGDAEPKRGADVCDLSGGGGEWGEIISTCTPNAGNACYAGAYLNDDTYTPVGQCTWFVATHAYIPWHANANGWIADDNLYPVGSIPEVNSIVVFTPGGFYSELGHVAWVVAVNGAEFTVEEDNVVGGGTEDMRIVPNADGTEGFIYPN